MKLKKLKNKIKNKIGKRLGYDNCPKCNNTFWRREISDDWFVNRYNEYMSHRYLYANMAEIFVVKRSVCKRCEPLLSMHPNCRCVMVKK